MTLSASRLRMRRFTVARLKPVRSASSRWLARPSARSACSSVRSWWSSSPRDALASPRSGLAAPGFATGVAFGTRPATEVGRLTLSPALHDHCISCRGSFPVQVNPYQERMMRSEPSLGGVVAWLGLRTRPGRPVGRMTTMVVFAEYIWMDGTQPTQKLRSKTKVLEIDEVKKIEDIPRWGFDGSSTNQATGDRSDCALHPASFYNDPIRGWPHILVMCEVFLADGKTPHPTNTR